MRYDDFSRIKLNEVYIDPNEDEFMKAHSDDARKPRLTLRHINRLKKIRAMSNLENVKKSSVISAMYGIPKEENNPGF
jgi:hypothetical protein